jgi:hypothetical protein
MQFSDASTAPMVSSSQGGRPQSFAQILDEEHWTLAVVVPPEEVRQMRLALERFVDRVFRSQPIRGVIEGRDLGERRPAGRKAHDVSTIRRSAVA